MTARTSDEILLSFQDSAALSDPTADTTKGPLYSLVGRPLSQVLQPTEELADTLAQLYSTSFAQTATDEQALAFLTNWGESPGTGQASTTRVYFMKFTRPDINQTITIPVGTIVGNSDQTLQYITTESGVIDGANSNTYYNAARRSYEIALNVQAVAAGPSYDIPAGRINTKISQIDGIDAVENREAAAGGVAAETPQNQVTRVQQKLLGLAVNTAQGNITRIKSFNPAVVQDVKVVVSSDRELFRRISYTPASDYYILGAFPKTVTETYISTVGGEKLIPLQNVPVYSINSVKINNVPISEFSLVSDTSFEFGGSAAAKDKLMLGTALLANDVVVISLSYNSLFQQIQNSVFADSKLFNTDELARSFFEIPISISIEGRSLPSYDPTAVKTDLLTDLQALIEPGVWQEQFFPDIIRQSLATSVPGLINPQIKMFKRSKNATSQIETVTLKDNEIAVYDANYVTVSIKTL